MTTKYNPRRHGRASETDPEDDNLRQEWAYARSLEEAHGGTWVPTASIFLRDDLQPRIEEGLDYDTARRYADVFDSLPPVTVQRGTLTLVDGRHRIRAAYLAKPQRYYIPVVEIDVPDDELIDHAVRANASHGRAPTQKERLHWVKDFLQRHPDWPDGKIAEWTGTGRTTVWERRGKDEVARATRERKRSDGTTYTVPVKSRGSVRDEHMRGQSKPPAQANTTPVASQSALAQLSGADDLAGQGTVIMDRLTLLAEALEGADANALAQTLTPSDLARKREVAAGVASWLMAFGGSRNE